MEIKNVVGRMVLDSRGNPTVEAEITLNDGAVGRASVPSGSSKGQYEAHELRDGGNAYGGFGVSKAINNINSIIAPALTGMRADDQFRVDRVMRDLDGTADKSNLGANAILAVSIANAYAAANSRNVPLWQQICDIAGTSPLIPMPMVNILNGGAHASAGPDIQEFMIVPIGASTMADAVRISSEIYHQLGILLAKNGHSIDVGDEGGYAPHIRSTTDALDYLVTAIIDAGYTPGRDASIALDVAASELFREGKYEFVAEGLTMTSEQLISYYVDLLSVYPIVSIEDALSDDDWDGWVLLTEVLGKHISLVADDLTVTNLTRLEKAIHIGAGNTLLAKANQIGTLTETIQAVNMAGSAGWHTVVSHRSGETEDVWLTHLAVGLGAGGIKTGATCRGERTAKYNELLRISENVTTYAQGYLPVPQL